MTAVFAWIMFLAIMGAFLGFLFLISYLFGRLMRWMYGYWRVGRDPFPMNPLLKLGIFQITRPGHWGDIWQRRG